MMTKQLSFKADDELLMMLEDYAIKHKMSKSEVIRLALQRLFELELEKEKVQEIKVEKGDKLF
ncbi:MAG: hypothetical protein L7G90_02775 [Candidatus Nanopusillus sp.]|nr:hypothetical protein [Candidatus Nanopusillus sp.]